jgi:DNA-directed RNA polymerase specialized sigma24 family protein
VKTNQVKDLGFTAFFMVAEPRLRVALVSSFGLDLGQEAAAEALAFAWERWERVSAISNPVGYLYRIGRNKAIHATASRKPVLFPDAPASDPPWVEPALAAALARLSERQRTVVMLLYCFEWSLAEVAEVLGMAKGSVQLHARRGMSKLRADLGVEQ